MNVRIYSVSKQMLAAFAIASMILSLLPFSFASAAQGAGAVWTNIGPCGSPQNVNQYEVNQDFFGHGSNFQPNTSYNWVVKEPGANGATLESGSIMTDGDGNFCGKLFTIDVKHVGGPYQFQVGDAKNDNFKVIDNRPTTGTITVNKVFSGNVPQGVDESNFKFKINTDAAVAFEEDGSNAVPNVALGAYTVVEDGVVDGKITVGDNTYSVSYSPSCSGTLTAEGATCTITNTYVPPTAPKQCVVYSDTTVASEATTVTVTPHPAWVPNLPKDLGDWIWSAPDADGIVTFTKVFNVDNAPTGATLTIAVDNSYTATLNGNPMSCDGSGTGNFKPADTCSAPVTQGVNTLVIASTNAGGANNPDAGNPAGVIFELVIDGSSCSPVPPPVVLGCTDPEALNYNPNATKGNPDAEDCEYEVPQCQNLLLNGSFEEPTVTANGGQWQIFGAVANWAITLSDGLELWKGIIPAYDGVQNAELDGNNPTKISQPVATIPGATYELSFAFAARANTGGAENNSVDATADGNLVVNASGSNTNWTVYNGTFTAADGSTDIAFQDRGAADSLGTLIDDARLCLVKRPMPNFVIDGYKYNDLDNDGALDEGEPTIEDWEFELLYDGEVVDATTTDENGYYKFEVEYGDVNLYDYEVREVLPNENSGWSQTAIYVNDGEVAAEACRMPELEYDERVVRKVNRSENDMLVYQPTLSCLFLNHKAPNNDDTPGGGGNGRKISLEDDEPDRRVDGDSDEDNGPGRVLGEQTSVVPAGAPNAGAGGASTTSNLMVGLVLAAAPRRTRLF